MAQVNNRKIRAVFVLTVVTVFCHPLIAQTVSGLKFWEHYTKNEIINILGEPDRYEGTIEGIDYAELTFVYGENKYTFDFHYPESEQQWKEVIIDNTAYEEFVWSENDEPFLTGKGRFTGILLKTPGSMIEFPSCSIRVGDSFDSLMRQRIGLQTLGKVEHFCAATVFSEGQYYSLGIDYGSSPMVEELNHFSNGFPPMDLKLETAKSVANVHCGHTELSVGDTLHFDYVNCDIEFHPQEPGICRIRLREDTWVTYKIKYDENFIIKKIEWIEELPFHY